MFASLKNKIREETGSDLSRLTTKISSTVHKLDSIRSKPHQGSTSSLNSIVSSDSLREDGSLEPEEFRKQIYKIESEFSKKFEQKEQEFHNIIKDKDNQLHMLNKEKDEAYKQITKLKESLKTVEEFKLKIQEQQENEEQLGSLQSQELSKIKNLVLLRDKELAEKNAALKESLSQLEKLRNEVFRLRRQEELVSDLQDDLESLRHSTSRDLNNLTKELAKSEQERKYLSDLVVILKQNSSNGNSDDKAFQERKLLEQRLEEAHLHLADIKTSWSEKIASLETQVGRLSRHAADESAERRRIMHDNEKLLYKIKQLEAEIDCNKFELSNKEAKIKRLTEDINELSFELKSMQLEDAEEVTFLRTELVSDAPV